MVYEGMLCRIKKNAKAYYLKSLPDSRFEIINLSVKSASVRYINKTEIIYNDNLYDIIKIKNINGNCYLFCLNDKAEEKLIAGFRGDINRNTGSNLPVRNQARVLLKFISEFIILKPIVSSEIITFNTIDYGYLKSIYNSFKTSPPSPPPELI
jgi:hypothetical protein